MSYRHLTAIAAGAFLALSATGCLNDSPEARLRRAVDAGDAAAFAAMCRYPVEREYPLHDILTPSEMTAYYPTLVDDSLRSIVGRSSWQSDGWYGSSLADGQYLWLDTAGRIAMIPYKSAAELRMADSLTRAEKASLDYRLAAGWTPERCFADANADAPDAAVYRIDRFIYDNDDSRLPDFRLAIFRRSDVAPEAWPSAILYGDYSPQPSRMVYEFTDSSGARLTITDLWLDRRIILSGDTSTDTIPLTKVYWLDIINRYPQ